MIWSWIREAKSGGRAALDEFARRHRDPVASFLRRRGLAGDEAERLAGEVFHILYRDRFLSEAERTGGGFRDALLGIASRLSGRPGRAAMSDDTAVDGLFNAPRDEAFDGDWNHHLLRLALVQLRLRHPAHHEALRLVLEEGLDAGSERVAGLLREARALLAGLVRGEIAATCATPREFDEGMASLAGRLKG